MCRQFNVDDIYITREVTKYDPVGTIMAKVNSEWYIQIKDPSGGTGQTPDCWPKRDLIGGRIQLYRDYWKFFCDESESNGVYFTTLVEAKKDLMC